MEILRTIMEPPEEASPIQVQYKSHRHEESPLLSLSKDTPPRKQHYTRVTKITMLSVVACVLFVGLPKFFRNQKRGHSLISPGSGCPTRTSLRQKSHIGDPSRPMFAGRLDSNLVFCDDFDSDNVHQTWTLDNTLFGDGNGGFAYYTSKNVAVEDGKLHIRPGMFSDLGQLNGNYDALDVMTGNCTPFPACATFTVDECTIPDFAGCQRIGTPLVVLNPVTSGRITTQGRFDFTYGRIEARIRLPRGDWLWPAFWLMPSNDNYGPWPDSGEIDILEARGNDPSFTVAGTKGGRDSFTSCLHYAGNSWWHSKASAWASKMLGCGKEKICDWEEAFFTVGMFWSDKRMYSYVLLDGNIELILWDVNASAGFGPHDSPNGSELPPLPPKRSENERTRNVGPYNHSKHKNAPFDKPFYIILNLAVGGEQNGCPDPDFWGDKAIWCKQRNSERPDITASTVFWNARNQWLPTWEAARMEGREAFSIDWVKVWQ